MQDLKAQSIDDVVEAYKERSELLHAHAIQRLEKKHERFSKLSDFTPADLERYKDGVDFHELLEHVAQKENTELPPDYWKGFAPSAGTDWCSIDQSLSSLSDAYSNWASANEQKWSAALSKVSDVLDEIAAFMGDCNFFDPGSYGAPTGCTAESFSEARNEYNVFKTDSDVRRATWEAEKENTYCPQFLDSYLENCSYFRAETGAPKEEEFESEIEWWRELDVWFMKNGGNLPTPESPSLGVSSLKNALETLNRISVDLDLMKTQFYNVPVELFENGFGEAGEDFVLRYYDEQDLPSVGLITPENMAAKVPILYSSLVQLRVLPASYGNLDYLGVTLVPSKEDVEAQNEEGNSTEGGWYDEVQEAFNDKWPSEDSVDENGNTIEYSGNYYQSSGEGQASFSRPNPSVETKTIEIPGDYRNVKVFQASYPDGYAPGSEPHVEVYSHSTSADTLYHVQSLDWTVRPEATVNGEDFQLPLGARVISSKKGGGKVVFGKERYDKLKSIGANGNYGIPLSQYKSYGYGLGSLLGVVIEESTYQLEWEDSEERYNYDIYRSVIGPDEEGLFVCEECDEEDGSVYDVFFSGPPAPEYEEVASGDLGVSRKLYTHYGAIDENMLQSEGSAPLNSQWLELDSVKKKFESMGFTGYSDHGHLFGIQNHYVLIPKFKKIPDSGKNYDIPASSSAGEFACSAFGQFKFALDLGDSLYDPFLGGVIGIKVESDSIPFLSSHQALRFYGPTDAYEVIYNYQEFELPPLYLWPGGPESTAGVWDDYESYLKEHAQPNLRQVLGSQILVDINYVDAWSYTIKVYPSSQKGSKNPETGLYQPTGAPLRTITVSNPSAALNAPYELEVKSDELQFTLNGSIDSQNNAQEWSVELSKAGGAASLEGATRKEELEESYSNGRLTATETVTLDGTEISSTETEYEKGSSYYGLGRAFPKKITWGNRTVTYTNKEHPRANCGDRYYVTEKIAYSGSNWENDGREIDYESEGLVQKIKSPWLGDSTATTTYTASGRKLEYRKRVSRGVLSTGAISFSNGFQQMTSTMDDLSEVVTTYFSEGSSTPWMVKSVVSKIGRTATKYEYDGGASGTTVTIKSGFGTEQSITRGTETTIELNAWGGLDSRTNERIGGGPKPPDVTVIWNSKRLPQSGTITYSDGTTENLTEFDDLGQLTKWTDIYGKNQEAKLDILGRTHQRKDGALNQTFNLSDPLSPSVTVTGGNVSFNASAELNQYFQTTEVQSSKDLGFIAQPAIPGQIGSFEHDNATQTTETFSDGSIKSISAQFGSRGSKAKYSAGKVSGVPVTEVSVEETVSGSTTVRKMTYCYDPIGRLVEVRYPGADGSEVKSQALYDDRNREVTYVRPQRDNVKVNFDDEWRPILVTEGSRKMDYSYSLSGGEETVTTRIYDDSDGTPGWKVISESTAALNGTSWSLDPEGKSENGYSGTQTPLSSSVQGPDGASVSTTHTSDFTQTTSTINHPGGGSTVTTVDRNLVGDTERVEVDPSATSSYVITTDVNHQVSGITGPFIDATVNHSRTGSDHTVTVNDSADGQTHSVKTSSAGDLLLRTGFDDLDINIAVTHSLNKTTMSLAGGPTITTNAWGQMLSKVDPTGKGKRWVYNPDGTLDLELGPIGGIDYNFSKGVLKGFTFDYYSEYGGASFNQASFDYYNVGLLKEITDAAGFCAITYHETRLDVEDYSSSSSSSGSYLDGFKIDRKYDSRNRLAGLTVTKDSQTVLDVDYTITNGRITGVSSGSVSASYSNFVSGTSMPGTLSRGGLTTSYNRNPSDQRLTSITTTGAVDGVVSFSNGYSGNSISSITDNRFGTWNYSYDGHDQLTGASRTGQNFSYSYDGRGNRGGSTYNSADEMTAVAMPASTNQYLIFGQADPSATIELYLGNATTTPITVTTDEEGKFVYPVSLPENPTDQAMVMPALVRGTIAGGGTNGTDAVADEVEVLLVFPRYTGSQHDGAGNLAADEKWVIEWDARNHLRRMETRSEVVAAGAPLEVLSFEYDAQERRIFKEYERQEINSQSQSKTAEYRTHRFLYDGWNLVAELIDTTLTDIETDVATTSSTMRTYTWGLDLSHSFQGVGGIGGLLAVYDSASGETWLPIYDGRGNIVRVVDGSTRQTVIEREYGPFGEVISETGDPNVIEGFAFGFSSKYRDRETGDLYFGYRYYRPDWGRWLSREPLGEFESLNAYAYCHSDPINQCDYLGLDDEYIQQLAGRIDWYEENIYYAVPWARALDENVVEPFNQAMSIGNPLYVQNPFHPDSLRSTLEPTKVLLDRYRQDGLKGLFLEAAGEYSGYNLLYGAITDSDRTLNVETGDLVFEQYEGWYSRWLDGSCGAARLALTIYGGRASASVKSTGGGGSAPWTFKRSFGQLYDDAINLKYYGGGPSKKPHFRTSRGARYLDNLINGLKSIGVENKCGSVDRGVRKGTMKRKKLAETLIRVRKQARKDQELVQTGQVGKIEWNLSGRYPRLQSWLESLGLEVFVRPMP